MSSKRGVKGVILNHPSSHVPGGGHSNVKVKGMCLPENKNRGHSVKAGGVGFRSKKGLLGGVCDP